MWAPLMLMGCIGDSSLPGDLHRMEVVDSAGVEIVTSSGPAWDEDTRWRVDPSPTLSLGGQEDVSGPLIWQVRGGQRMTDGRIALLVGGRNTPRVVIFDSAGELDRSIGRSGQGPGEFIDPSHLQVLPGDTLVVWERGFGRVSAFGPDGTLSSTRELDPDRIRAAIGATGRSHLALPLADGSFIVGSPLEGTPLAELPLGEPYRPPILYSRVHRDYSVDVLGRYPNSEGIPFRHSSGEIRTLPPLVYARPAIAAGADRVVVMVSRGDEAGIDVFDEASRKVQVIRRETEAIPMSGEDWEALIDINAAQNALAEERREELAAFFRDMLPEQTHFPPMTLMALDRAGFLWGMDRRVGSESLWSVFDTDGRWLGRIELPLSRILDIGEVYVLGVHVDPLMVESVREYRLDRRHSGSRP